MRETYVLGGNDDTCFGKKQKYNRGRLLKKQWVFDITEKKTDRFLL